MDLRVKILSYSNQRLDMDTHGEWWWDGAPIFTSEHTIKGWFNGQKLPFDPVSGEFLVHFNSPHDIKMGIIEISILIKGVFSDECIGYCFRRIEELLHRSPNSIHYLRIFPFCDPIEGFLCCKQCKKVGFKPGKMDMFLAVHVTMEKSKFTELSSTYSLTLAKLFTGEQVAVRIFDLQEVFAFLFRDLRNLSELVYGGRELMLYYSEQEKEQFRKLPPFPYENPRPSILERLKNKIFRPSDSTIDKRVAYSNYLKKTVLGPMVSPYQWHIEPEEFYRSHLKNYRYAIASYGQAFLSLHSILNVIKKKIIACVCMYCQNKSADSEKRFFHTFSGIPFEDILHDYSKYQQYVIFIERESNTLYVSFKGTLHKRDALIDIDYKYHKHKGALYHKGIFQEAFKFFKENEELLSILMKRYKLDKIKLVGQSLGGALSTLVCTFLKESSVLSKYKISSIAYSSPPIVSTPEKYKQWATDDPDTSITNIIYGTDIVPMLCLGKVFELRLLTTHLYAINISKYENKARYIKNLLKKMQRHGMTKLSIPGTIYQIKHTRTHPSTFLVRRTNSSEFSSIKITSKGFIHHTPGVMLNSFRKSLKYFYDIEEE
ncbi:hypothetical protein NEOKW01_0765 [Nematocida sp. AWRm80]|nr:hypothetical protein NEOKW01_0765 [Nematocida sp. AWRm80]